MLCAARNKRSCCQQRTVTPIASLCIWLLVAFAGISSARGRDVQVGGEQGWTKSGSFDDLNAVVGDRLVSDYAAQLPHTKLNLAGHDDHAPMIVAGVSLGG